MKNITYLFIAIILSFTFISETKGQFNSNNLAILVAAGSVNNTTVSVVEINKTTANQTAIQTISIPGSGDDAIRVSGSATSTLYAANSADGTLFCFTGHNSTNTGVNANTLNPRAVVTINNSGTVTLATTYTGGSGNQTRCATTLNNVNFFIADQGGQYTNSATVADPSGNFRGMKTFGGIVYVGRASGTAGLIEVSTTSALTGGTIDGLPGLSNNASHQDFYFVSSGANGSTFDVLYTLSATSNTAGVIAKYSLVSGNWEANGTYVTNFGGFGIAAEKSGSGAVLYVTTGLGALTANSVIKLTDAAGYNSTININSENNVTLFTTEAGTIIKGIAFAPKVPSVNTISVSSINGDPFCVDASNGAAGSVGFTATGTYSNSTFTVKLSNAASDFTSPVNIGSSNISGTDPTGTINITIPANTPSGTGYRVRIDAASPSVTGTPSSVFEIINGAKNVSNASASGQNLSADLSWTNPAGCYDEIMVVVKPNSSINAAPSGNGSAYNANLAFGSGSSFDGTGYVVYKGSVSPQTVTNLTNGTLYYVKYFTRKGTNWSSGVEVTVTPFVPPVVVSIIVPQYIQGLNGTNNNRVPFVYRATLNNLQPNTTYRYVNQLVTYLDLPTVSGAGNCIFVNSDNSFTRSSGPSLATAGNYGEFTTNASGSYTGWFINEPTGNARFVPGNYLHLRITLNDGAGGTTGATYLTIGDSVKVLNFGTDVDPAQCTGIYGRSSAAGKDFVFLYDNISGTGRPISGSIAEDDGLNLSAVTSYALFFRDSVDNIAGAWGTIIPNQLANGVRRIERRLFANGSLHPVVAINNNGVWPVGGSTVNPTGGLSAIRIDSTDAPIPVQFVSFNASVTNSGIAIQWSTATETNNLGFEIERTSPINNNALTGWEKIGFIQGSGNSTNTNLYSFIDEKPISGKNIYRLKQIDFDGSFSYSIEIEVENNLVMNFELEQNYPNPFNPKTNIKYQIAEDNFVTLKLYDFLGREVVTLVNEYQTAGKYNIELNLINNNNLASGVYYYKLAAGNFSDTKKLILMK